jgi:hypothetical protein
MKERLVEDWLIRINERGYEVPFCQSLLAQGYRVLRCGHSPTEHGKDVLAVAREGEVCAYQLKTGDFGLAEINKYRDQLAMLVEARPIHPGLPDTFAYRPFLVTTGEFKDPAISLIEELNAGWKARGLPALTPINGRQLHVDFVSLSSDFWPVEAPAVRRFRELYLVDGRGDLEVAQYAGLLIQILRAANSSLDMERRVTAANIFASYLLSEFYNQHDYWSVFQGWTVCASQIAWAGESANIPPGHWSAAFELAKHAAVQSLEDLCKEVLQEDAFRVCERELDDVTRTRNTIALAAAACWQLLAEKEAPGNNNFQRLVKLTATFVEQGRLFFWGEGAFHHFLTILWLLERGNEEARARDLLSSLIELVAKTNARGGAEPFDDPYFLPDECLAKVLKIKEAGPSPGRVAAQSYSLFPLILLAARRGMRTELERAWREISHVDLTWFEPEQPRDALLWRGDKGKEFTDQFPQPQSWKQLCEIAFRDRRDRLPQVLQQDRVFGLLFVLAFPHRIMPSLTKHLDSTWGPMSDEKVGQ